jgi:hypothetical protein
MQMRANRFLQNEGRDPLYTYIDKAVVPKNMEKPKKNGDMTTLIPRESVAVPMLG